jgi:hypothetical protein
MRAEVMLKFLLVYFLALSEEEEEEEENWSSVWASF